MDLIRKLYEKYNIIIAHPLPVPLSWELWVSFYFPVLEQSAPCLVKDRRVDKPKANKEQVISTLCYDMNTVISDPQLSQFSESRFSNPMKRQIYPESQLLFSIIHTEKNQIYLICPCMYIAQTWGGIWSIFKELSPSVMHVICIKIHSKMHSFKALMHLIISTTWKT